MIYSKKVRALLDAKDFAGARALMAPAKPRTRPKARNTTRRNREYQRAYGSVDRVLWVGSLPCCVCARGPSVNAHVGRKGKGGSRKADADQIAPMCHRHHTELDDVLNVRLFEKKYNLDLASCAAATERAWLEHQESANG